MFIIDIFNLKLNWQHTFKLWPQNTVNQNSPSLQKCVHKAELYCYKKYGLLVEQFRLFTQQLE